MNRYADILSNFARRNQLAHHNGTIHIQLFAFHCIAADAVLRLLLFVGQDTGEGHFRKLSALPANHGDSVAAACRQLFGAFLFRNPIQERQCRHSDEPFDLLPVLLAFQFGTYYVAGPLLHHKAPVADAHQPLGHFFHPFRAGCGRISAFGSFFPSFPASC